jgi:hypothetical protein
MSRIARIVKQLLPTGLREAISLRRHCLYGTAFLSTLPKPRPGLSVAESDPTNPLRAFFDSRTTGPGVWKWRHYFDIYHRHLSKFRGQPVRVVEIGIYSGGSLDMWREYFGTGLMLHGVDIEAACKTYERPGVQVHIGDQADRGFWRAFTKATGPIDVIIDDGGHTPEQQRVTLEETLPQLRPGGVFICEDIHGRGNGFTTFVSRLVDELHASTPSISDDPEKQVFTLASSLQSTIHSVHHYPFVVVIEKRLSPVGELASAKHGTEWQPFGAGPKSLQQ